MTPQDKFRDVKQYFESWGTWMIQQGKFRGAKTAI